MTGLTELLPFQRERFAKTDHLGANLLPPTPESVQRYTADSFAVSQDEQRYQPPYPIKLKNKDFLEDEEELEDEPDFLVSPDLNRLTIRGQYLH